MIVSQNAETVSKRKIWAVVGAILLLYGVLIAFNVTTSSLGLNFASADQANTSKVIFGESRPIRSDEWLRSTPFQIGRLHDSWKSDFLSPFEYRQSNSEGLPSRLVSVVMFPERAMVEGLGERGFATIWWLPVVLGFLSIFAFFVVNGRRVGQSVVVALLVILAPTTAWWSYSPLEVIWPCLVGAVTLRLAIVRSPSGSGSNGAHRRALVSPVLLSVVGGISLSRLPFVYQPWSIPAFLLLGALTLDLLRSDGLLRRAIRPLVIMGLTAVLLAGLWYVLNRTQYSTLAQTVYPGGRRSEGGGLAVPLFSGVFDFLLARRVGASIAGTNQSEAALGWLVIPVVAFLVGFVNRALRATTDAIGNLSRWMTTSVTGIVLLAWGIIKWPTFLLQFNPLRLLPGDRLIQILSVVALLPAFMAIFRITEDLDWSRRRLVATWGALLTALLCLEAGTAFRSTLPSVEVGQVWAVSVVVAFGVFALVAFPNRVIALLPLLAFAVWSTASVNPVVSGMGDLVESKSASVLSSAVRNDPSMRRVGSDDVFVDALVAANGLPLMSGQQGWGPNREAYRRIDPQEIFADQWNRGASYVRFSWDPSLGEDLSVVGSGDQIVISISPCNSGLKDLGLGWVISSAQLSADCLTESSVFKWMDLDRWLYAVA